MLAAGGDEQAVAFWDLESGELLRGTTYHDDYLGAVAAVRDDGPPRFVTGTLYGGALLVWGPGQAAPLELSTDEDAIGSLATASVDGRSLVAAGGLGIDVWDLARNDQLASFEPDDGTIRALSRHGSCQSTTRPSRSMNRSPATRMTSSPWTLARSAVDASQ